MKYIYSEFEDMFEDIDEGPNVHIILRDVKKTHNFDSMVGTPSQIDTESRRLWVIANELLRVAYEQYEEREKSTMLAFRDKCYSYYAKERLKKELSDLTFDQAEIEIRQGMSDHEEIEYNLNKIERKFIELLKFTETIDRIARGVA